MPWEAAKSAKTEREAPSFCSLMTHALVSSGVHHHLVSWTKIIIIYTHTYTRTDTHKHTHTDSVLLLFAVPLMWQKRINDKRAPTPQIYMMSSPCKPINQRHDGCGDLGTIKDSPGSQIRPWLQQHSNQLSQFRPDRAQAHAHVHTHMHKEWVWPADYKYAWGH